MGQSQLQLRRSQHRERRYERHLHSCRRFWEGLLLDALCGKLKGLDDAVKAVAERKSGFSAWWNAKGDQENLAAAMADLRTAMQDAQFEMTADLGAKMEDVGKDLRAKIGSDVHDEAEALKVLMQEGNAELMRAVCEHVGESPDTLRARHDEVVGKLDEVLANQAKISST